MRFVFFFLLAMPSSAFADYCPSPVRYLAPAESHYKGTSITLDDAGKGFVWEGRERYVSVYSIDCGEIRCYMEEQSGSLVFMDAFSDGYSAVIQYRGDPPLLWPADCQ